MPQPLDYFNPEARPPELHGRYLSFAFACGAGPLAVNVLAHVLWATLPAPGQILLGMWLVAIGFTFVLIGGFVLLMHVLINWGYLIQSPDRKIEGQSIGWTLLVLLASLVVSCALVTRLSSVAWE